jgi:hypothetical protein
MYIASLFASMEAPDTGLKKGDVPTIWNRLVREAR